MFKILLQILSLKFLRLHSMPEYEKEMKDKEIGEERKTVAA